VGDKYKRFSAQMQRLVTAAMVRCTRKRKRTRAEVVQGGRTTAGRSGSGNNRARCCDAAPCAAVFTYESEPAAFFL